MTDGCKIWERKQREQKVEERRKEMQEDLRRAKSKAASERGEGSPSERVTPAEATAPSGATAQLPDVPGDDPGVLDDDDYKELIDLPTVDSNIKFKNAGEHWNDLNGDVLIKVFEKFIKLMQVGRCDWRLITRTMPADLHNVALVLSGDVHGESSDSECIIDTYAYTATGARDEETHRSVMALVKLLERILGPPRGREGSPSEPRGPLRIQAVLCGHQMDCFPILKELDGCMARVYAHRVREAGDVFWEVGDALDILNDDLPSRIDPESEWQLVIYADELPSGGEGSPSEPHGSEPAITFEASQGATSPFD